MKTENTNDSSQPFEDPIGRTGNVNLWAPPRRRYLMRMAYLLLLLQCAVGAVAVGRFQDDPKAPAGEAVKANTKTAKKKQLGKVAKRGRAAEDSLQEIKRIVMSPMEFAFSPDSKNVVFTIWTCDYRVFELTSAKELLYRVAREQAVVGSGTSIRDVVFGSDGRVVLSYADEMIRVRDKTGERVLEMQPRPLGQAFDNLKLSVQGRWVVGRGPTEVRVWDLESGAELKRHAIHTFDLDLGQDGRTLVTIDNDHWIRVWDATTKREFSGFADLTKKIIRVKFSPDGRTLLCWCRGDQDLYLVEPTTGQPMAIYKGHAGNINDATFFPDNRRVASVGADRTLRVWSKATGAQLNERAFPDDVRLVGISPDGSYLVIVLKTETVFYRLANTNPSMPKAKR
jgi:WD40 repeat protein